jgi:hypothetical protein
MRAAVMMLTRVTHQADVRVAAKSYGDDDVDEKKSDAGSKHDDEDDDAEALLGELEKAGLADDDADDAKRTAAAATAAAAEPDEPVESADEVGTTVWGVVCRVIACVRGRSPRPRRAKPSARPSADDAPSSARRRRTIFSDRRRRWCALCSLLVRVSPITGAGRRASATRRGTQRAFS